jgi:Na+-transporting NADH:ubiquinone oxidoreductase subunit NqrC
LNYLVELHLATLQAADNKLFKASNINTKQSKEAFKEEVMNELKDLQTMTFEERANKKKERQQETKQAAKNQKARERSTKGTYDVFAVQAVLKDDGTIEKLEIGGPPQKYFRCANGQSYHGMDSD